MPRTSTPATAATVDSQPGRPSPAWRAAALESLVDAAVADLRADSSPRRSIRAMAEVGASLRELGADSADVLDTRLDRAVAGWAEAQRRLRQVDPDADLEQAAAQVAAPLFGRVTASALDGFPHPGPWIASSVDEVPCALHGYEADVLDCLRMQVETHLVDTVDATRARCLPVPGQGAAPGLWVGVATLAACLEAGLTA